MTKRIVVGFVLIACLAMVTGSSLAFEGPGQLAASEMSASIGAGFWGGLACGASVAGIGLLGAAMLVPTAGLGTAVALSTAMHVAALCYFL